MTRFAVLELPGDNDRLHRGNLAKLIVATDFPVRRAWVQSEEPPATESMKAAAVQLVDEERVKAERQALS